MMSNDTLNAFYEGLFDNDGVLDDEGNYTDEKSSLDVDENGWTRGSGTERG